MEVSSFSIIIGLFAWEKNVHIDIIIACASCPAKVYGFPIRPVSGSPM